MIELKNFSSAELKRAASDACGEYTLLVITPDIIESVDEVRLIRVLEDSGADAVYADFIKNGSRIPLIEMQAGSVRDDFDFGPVMLVRTAVLKSFVENIDSLNYSAFYAFWLSMHGKIVHLPEYVTMVKSAPVVIDGEQQFQYVDPRNRQAQIEKEGVFTRWLSKRGAIVSSCHPVKHVGDFPVEATVVIPVKNRVKTIGDAIKSALNQKCNFEINVIVVDNYSEDGTSEFIEEFAAADSRLIHVIPDPGHGIGGCWNCALDDPRCGRFAIQLDSDDVYSSELTLQKIIDKFRETGAAMVIGSYTLTDFDLNIVPPGLIDHAEWTDDNGPNNALRINGLGAPRAFFTPIARRLRFPDVSYGEDYAMALSVCRNYRIARIFDSLYFCRRWGGNSDSNLSQEKINANNRYKDWVRSVELAARTNAK